VEQTLFLKRCKKVQYQFKLYKQDISPTMQTQNIIKIQTKEELYTYLSSIENSISSTEEFEALFTSDNKSNFVTDIENNITVYFMEDSYVVGGERVVTLMQEEHKDDYIFKIVSPIKK